MKEARIVPVRFYAKSATHPGYQLEGSAIALLGKPSLLYDGGKEMNLIYRKS